MGASFSVHGQSVYGEKKCQADIERREVEVLNAAVQAARQFGSVDRLAVAMGMKASTLEKKLNPLNETHHLTLLEAVRLQQITGFPYVLQAMAAALDHHCVRTRPDGAEGDPLEAFYNYQYTHSELTAAAVDAMRSGGDVSPNQCRRVEFVGNEHVASVNALMSAVASRVPGRRG